MVASGRDEKIRCRFSERKGEGGVRFASCLIMIRVSSCLFGLSCYGTVMQLDE